MDISKYLIAMCVVTLSTATVWAKDANNPQMTADYLETKLDEKAKKTDEFIEKSNENELNNDAINWFPIIFYTQESSLALGGGTMRAFKEPGAAENARSNNIKAMAFYTLIRQFLVELAPEFYFSQEKCHSRAFA